MFECEQATNPALETSIGANGKHSIKSDHTESYTDSSEVIAAATFGAVVRSRDQNFTIGDGKNFDGRRARTPSQLAALNKYSDRLRDYCHYGDPMCAVGSTPADVYVHLDYFLEHNEEVVSWVAEKAKANNGKVSEEDRPSEPSPSPSSSPSSTPSPQQVSSPAQISTPSKPSPSPQASPSPSSSTPPLSSISAKTNTPLQSSSPTSAIAKSAAAPSATPSIIASATRSTTDTSEAQPAQTGNAQTGSGNTGAASTLSMSSGFGSSVAIVFAALVLAA